MSRRSPSRGRLARAAGSLALALALLSGCSASSDGGDADVAQEPASDVAADDAGGGEDSAVGGSGESGDRVEHVNQALPEGRMIARDATVTVAVEDVGPAAAEVRAAAAAADGWVVSEEVEPDTGPDTYRGYAVLVISVPSSSLDATVSSLSSLGRVTGSSMSSQDVTAQYTDTTARIETLEASITRLRGLMEDATGIEDIVALERELAEREADLDALQALAESLENDVARSSITITLHEVDPLEPLDEPEQASTGFTAGLKSGWEAFLSGVTFVLTALGALLPFAIVAAIIAAPVLWWRRRRSAGATAAGATAFGATTADHTDATAGRKTP